MKKIWVTGDLVWDTHIARLPLPARGYHQPHAQTQLKNRYGGAWYLRDVVESALRQSAIRADVLAPRRAKHEEIEDDTGPCGIAKGFTVWEWFADAKNAAWRIKEFLGCQSARWEPDKKKRATSKFCQTLGPQPKQPDVLVVDDLCLGFAFHENAWPACLRDPALAPGIIVAKAAPPFDRPLWQKLLSREWGPKTTLVVAGASLRDAGARLGRGFSWDQTIEEVQKAFSPGGTGWPLRHCHRVVVCFGRSGAAVFSREKLSPDLPESEMLRFERFVFDPACLEGTWSADIKGGTFGATSLMTALLVARELTEKSVDPGEATAGEKLKRPILKPSVHIAVSRSLAAARELHRRGAGGTDSEFMPDVENKDSVVSASLAVDPARPPEKQFYSSFNRELLDHPVLVKKKDMPAECLLTDVLGVSIEFLTVAAEQIVRYGTQKVLESVPCLKCGDYFTVDRAEIESLNTVRNLILDYSANAADKRPLSIAVFGQPGSGKSYAIKQLAEALFGKAKAVLEYNLSQIEDIDALHEAFHEVRDKSVQGQLPLVFWDEFDSPRGEVELGWLKEFLAPMQDWKFFAKGREHPFGKCIFIFAGGTKRSFEDFDLSACDEESAPVGGNEEARPAGGTAAQDPAAKFKSVKGPDFVSRLRGFVNIKGPNPLSATGDQVHVVRRALLLREFVRRHHKAMLQPGSEELIIHPAVLSAFLTVKEYRHGARSMEAIVSLSRLQGCRHFGPSELPPRDVVRMHVSDDFFNIVEDQTRVHFGPDDVERLAAIMHRNWLEQTEANHPTPGGPRSKITKAETGGLEEPYVSLSEGEKEGNRKPARLTQLRLDKLGFEIRRVECGEGGGGEDLNNDTPTLDLIARSEHRRWMREKLLAGMTFGELTERSWLLHADICKFAGLTQPEKRLDHAIAAAIQEFLNERGLKLVRKDA